MTDLTKYENETPWCGGILFQVKTMHNCFVSVEFGNDSNGDDIDDEDCNDYIMIDYLRINKDLELESFDGFTFEFNQEKSGFDGSIIEALPAALDFIEVDISDLEPVIKL